MLRLQTAKTSSKIPGQRPSVPRHSNLKLLHVLLCRIQLLKAINLGGGLPIQCWKHSTTGISGRFVWGQVGGKLLRSQEIGWGKDLENSSSGHLMGRSVGTTIQSQCECNVGRSYFLSTLLTAIRSRMSGGPNYSHLSKFLNGCGSWVPRSFSLTGPMGEEMT